MLGLLPMNPHFPSPHQGTCCEKCFESMTHAWLFGHKKRHQVALQCLACQWWNKPRFQRLPSYTNQQLPTNLSCIMSFFLIYSNHFMPSEQMSINLEHHGLMLESWILIFSGLKRTRHLNRNPTSPHPLASRMHFPKFLPGSGVQWMTLPKPAELQGVLEPGNRWSFIRRICPSMAAWWNGSLWLKKRVIFMGTKSHQKTRNEVVNESWIKSMKHSCIKQTNILTNWQRKPHISSKLYQLQLPQVRGHHFFLFVLRRAWQASPHQTRSLRQVELKMSDQLGNLLTAAGRSAKPHPKFCKKWCDPRQEVNAFKIYSNYFATRRNTHEMN